MDRRVYTWRTEIAPADGVGSALEQDFSSFWSPEKDFIDEESIARAAAARQSAEEKRKYFGVSAKLKPSLAAV